MLIRHRFTVFNCETIIINDFDVLTKHFVFFLNHYRHYLVPFTQAKKSKWKRSGIKLHIFNDHTFVAKHLSRYVRDQSCLLLYVYTYERFVIL